MKLLLDTHAILWWFLDHPMLSRRARSALQSSRHEFWISAVSIFEIETQAGLGKLEIPPPLETGWARVVQDEGWAMLAVNHEHARVAARLPTLHRDPFDRLLTGQALVEKLTVLTCDEKIAQLGARTLW